MAEYEAMTLQKSPPGMTMWSYPDRMDNREMRKDSLNRFDLLLNECNIDVI